MKLNGCEVDFVISQYLFKEAKGTVTLLGYLCSDTLKDTPKGHLYTYFMCAEMLPADEDSKESVVYVQGKIAKRGRLVTQTNGSQLMSIVVRSRSDDGHTSILHMVARDKLARYISSIDEIEGLNVLAEGKLQAKHKSVELNISGIRINGKEVVYSAGQV